MTDRLDFLREDYHIETPEGVAFGYEVADIGTRFIGALIDTAVLGIALLVINLLLRVMLERTGDLGRLLFGDELSWQGGLALALYALLNFVIFWGYYVFFELLWNGQTPGKRFAGTRVVCSDGNPVGPLEVIVRNLVRVVDFLPTGYGLGLVTMFLNRQARRLGDFAAGTLVVKERRGVTLESLDLAAPGVLDREDPARADALLREYPYIHRLSVADYELIRETLARADQQAVDPALLHRLARAIAVKLEHPAPAEAQARPFLEDVAAAYRSLKAQS